MENFRKAYNFPYTKNEKHLQRNAVKCGAVTK